MRRIIAVAGTAALIAVGLTTSPALADPGSQKTEIFVIQETHNMYVPGSAMFTASGPAVDNGLLCASGTYADDLPFENPSEGYLRSGKLLLKGTAVYTCDDGSGTFVARKNIHLQLLADYTFLGDSVFKIIGGTGEYVRLRGTGRDVGEASFITGDGTATIYGHINP